MIKNTPCLFRVVPKMQLIMVAVSLWTRPPALHLCAGPKKFTPSAHQRDDELPHSTNFSTSATVGARVSPPRVHSSTAGPRNGDVGHRDEQLWHVHGQTNSLHHGNLPLRHDGEVNLLDLHNEGIDHNVNCGIPGLTNCLDHGINSAQRQGCRRP